MRILGILLAVILGNLASLGAWSQTPAAGTSFWLGFMSNSDDGPNDNLVVTISAEFATSGTIEIPGQSWSQVFYVDAQSSTQVSLPDGLAEVSSDQLVESKSIHIQSLGPVTVQALNYAESSADATRILPETMLGTKYLAASYQGLNDYSSELLIVATEDGTEVQIIPSTTTSAGNAANVPFLVQLDAGACYRLEASGMNDLTGTQITATAVSGKCRPFAVFAGAGCANIPANCFQACDHLFEQLYDLEKWGTDYIITPFGFNVSSDYSSIGQPRYTYRIMAAQNGTSVTIDNVTAINLQAGQFMEYNGESQTHCIHSNQPIAVIQYMQGISCGGNGDPAMVTLDPLNHTVTSARFNVSNSSVINQHYFNLVVTAQALGQCWLDGALIPVNQFTSVATCSGYFECSIPVNPGNHRIHCPSGCTGILYGISDDGVSTTSYLSSLAVDVHTPPISWEQTVCSSGNVQLVVPTDYSSPQWYYANDANSILSTQATFTIAAPIENAAYELRAINDLSGCIDTFYFSVESPDAIPVSIVQDQLSVCSFETVTLTAISNEANAFYLYNWSADNELLGLTTSSISVEADESVEYAVTVSTPSGCAQTTSVTTLVVNQGNVARFAVSEEVYRICAGESVDLSIEAEEVVWRDNFDPSISWGDWQTINGGIESNVCGTISGNGLYFNGAFPREAITQPIDLSGGGTVYFSLKVANGSAPCDNAEPGDNVVLAYSVANGPWTDIQVFYESAYPDFVSIEVPLPAGASASNVRLRWRQIGFYGSNQDNWVLENAFVGRNGLSSLSCNWSPQGSLSAATGSYVTASPVQTTLYYVTTIDPATQCDYRDSVIVEVGEPFSLEMSDDAVVCGPQEWMISAEPSEPGQYQFQWTPSSSLVGAFTQNPTADVQQTQTYQVQATSDYGCIANGNVTLTLASIFTMSLTASDNSLCFGQAANLQAQLSGDLSGVVLEWQGDASINGLQTQTVSVAPVNDVVVTCTATHASTGCQLEESIDISVTPAFSVEVNPGTIASCLGIGQSISAICSLNEPVQWNWSPNNWVANDATQTTQLTTNNSGALTATAITQDGCEASASIDVAIAPLVTDLGSDIQICEGEQALLQVQWTAGYSILWSTGSTQSSIVADETGLYAVTVESPEGCISEDEIMVDVIPFPVINLQPNLSACEGDEIELRAGLSGPTYVWSTGASTSLITVSESGTYSVEASNNGCTANASTTVTFHSLPEQPFLPEYEFCFAVADDVNFLDAENAGSTYLWNNDSTSRIFILTEPGVYSVWITNSKGCRAEFQTEVLEDCLEALYVPNSFTPDGDGINDAWMIYGDNIKTFHLQLYNRMGEMFFESFDISQPWLGQRRDGDHFVESEVYPYIIRYQTVEPSGALSEEKILRGFVTLIR
jgi:gliding motility-associated-like protein